MQAETPKDEIGLMSMTTPNESGKNMCPNPQLVEVEKKEEEMTEDEDSDTDEDLMKEIIKVKQEVNSKEELMAG